MNFLLNTLEIIPQADVLASLRLFAREVMPAFADAKPANGAGRPRECLMPLFGALELTTVAARLPSMPDLDTEAWSLPGAEILQLAFEVPRDTESLLPRALHPAIPTYYATILVARYPESPVGPFLLAQLRLMARAGAHPRGYVLAAVASTAPAAEAAAGALGLPGRPGCGVAEAPPRSRDGDGGARGRDASSTCALVDPEPISGGDVQYIHAVTLARAPLDGATAPRLIQVDSALHLPQGRARPARGELARRRRLERGLAEAAQSHLGHHVHG